MRAPAGSGTDTSQTLNSLLNSDFAFKPMLDDRLWRDLDRRARLDFDPSVAAVIQGLRRDNAPLSAGVNI